MKKTVRKSSKKNNKGNGAPVFAGAFLQFITIESWRNTLSSVKKLTCMECFENGEI